jgi:hypothetical protein
VARTAGHEPGPGDEQQAKVAQALVRTLWELSKSLRGVSARMNKGGEGDDLLIVQAARTIVRAHGAGLTVSIFNADMVAPGRGLLGDERMSNGPFPADLVKSSDVGRSDSTNISPPPARPIKTHGLQSHETLKRRIEGMLQDIERNGDPGKATMREMEHAAHETLQALWASLSARYPKLLTPKVALYKHDLLPGIDPWLGNDRDFRKAGWVCSCLAKLVERQWDVLTLAEAAREYGVLAETVGRSCQSGQIKTNGKRGRDLRINRVSLEEWIRGHRKRKAREQARKRARVPEKQWYRCAKCQKGFERVGKQPCPHCHDDTLVFPERKRGGSDAGG